MYFDRTSFCLPNKLDDGCKTNVYIFWMRTCLRFLPRKIYIFVQITKKKWVGWIDTGAVKCERAGQFV